MSRIEVALEPWANLKDRGWYAGNTHVHYPDSGELPSERLRLDPRVEDLAVLIASVVYRGGTGPSSWNIPIGIHGISDASRIVDIGEETRHNLGRWEISVGFVKGIELRFEAEHGHLTRPAG